MLAAVTDARGNGAGWSPWLTLTPLREYDLEANQYVVGGRTLAPGSLTVVTPPSAMVLDRTGSPSEALALMPAGAALDSGQPVPLFAASTGSGMGRYAFGPLEVVLTVPARAYARACACDALGSVATNP